MMMTKQKGICEECKVEYEYDYNPKFPRKYCPECSAKKKQEYLDKNPVNEGWERPVDKDSGQPINDFGDTKPEVVRLGLTTIEEIQAKSKAERFTHNPKRGQFDKDPVGLAVDIFCAILIDKKDARGECATDKVLMSHCTELVKQAMKELS